MVRRLRALLAGALTAGALLGAAPGSASAAVPAGAAPAATPGTASVVPGVPRLQVGVQFKGMWADYTDAQRVQVLDKLAAAGADTVRIDVSWAMLQPDARGQFSAWGVGFVDKVVAMAASRGLHPLITLWMAPDWANGGRGERVLPDDPADFGAIARWSAARWRGKVSAWEVWNEPNDPYFMRGADPAAYVRLLKAAYRGFKAGAPETPVVFGGTSYVDTDWVARAYAAGAAGSFDVMGTHPYQGMADAPPEKPDDGERETLDHVRVLRDLMVRNGDALKPIWFTESGWSAHTNPAGTMSWERGVSATVQADYLVRMLRHVQRQYPYVTHVFWYTERNQATGDAHQDNFGLMTRDLRAKPAYTALKGYVQARDAAAAPAPTPVVDQVRARRAELLRRLSSHLDPYRPS